MVYKEDISNLVPELYLKQQLLYLSTKAGKFKRK